MTADDPKLNPLGNFLRRSNLHRRDAEIARLALAQACRRVLFALHEEAEAAYSDLTRLDEDMAADGPLIGEDVAAVMAEAFHAEIKRVLCEASQVRRWLAELDGKHPFAMG